MGEREGHGTGASLADLVGSNVVVDTDASYVFVGTLKEAGADFLAMEEVDVHDMRDSSKASREVYTLEAAKLGVRANRRRALIRVERVVSVSRLDDVVTY